MHRVHVLIDATYLQCKYRICRGPSYYVHHPRPTSLSSWEMENRRTGRNPSLWRPLTHHVAPLHFVGVSAVNRPPTYSARCNPNRGRAGLGSAKLRRWTYLPYRERIFFLPIRAVPFWAASSVVRWSWSSSMIHCRRVPKPWITCFTIYPLTRFALHKVFPCKLHKPVHIFVHGRRFL